MSNQYAFVTLVTSDQYLPGALAVAAALKEVHPSPPQDPEVPFKTVCLVTPETVDVKTIKYLRRTFDSVIGVEVIEGNTASELQLLGRPDLHSVLTKIHVFRLTQFRKIIFLDADILPVRPLSHLFNLPYEFSAVPDVGWPDIFNSGLLVLTPGEDKFNEIMTMVRSKGSWDGGDQGVLNEWRGNNWNRLSFTYNTTPTASYIYAPAYERFGSQISAIHFIGSNKPWNDLPYRAPSSASQSSSEHVQVSEAILTSTSSPIQKNSQTYGYSALVDRWFDVYDRNYRKNLPQEKEGFESQRYENAWNESAKPSTTKEPLPAENVSKNVLGLEDLRRMALEGSGAIDQRPGEGIYLSLPLEGRIDLIRPKTELHTTEPETLVQATSALNLFSEEHIRTPTTEQPHWQGSIPYAIGQPPTPGPAEVPPSPYIKPLSLPVSNQSSPRLTSINMSVKSSGNQDNPISEGLQSSTFEMSTVSNAHPDKISNVSKESTISQGTPYLKSPEDTNVKTDSLLLVGIPPVQTPRPPSPPLLSWNPAVEPPPNVPPTPSAFPSDAYFPNVWDIPPSSSRLHAALTGSHPSLSSQFFEIPPVSQIPQRLIQEGHYSNIMGFHKEPSDGHSYSHPKPDINKVTSIFPWEQRPRHAPGRMFPPGEAPPPGVLYIEDLPAEPDSTPQFIETSESLTTETAQDENVISPQSQSSPPIGFMGARGFSNAWDTVPSIQRYAARLAKPPSTQPFALLPPRQRRRSESSYRSHGESDANSMDGDVEDEIDDSDNDTGTNLSSDGRSRGSKSGPTSPTGTSRTRNGKKKYRSYGVQTVPKDVRSVAIQVSQETSTGKLSSKYATKPSAPSSLPFLDLPKAPPIQELQLPPEPSAIMTPSATNMESFIQQPTGILSPRLHDAYTFAASGRASPNASSGTQTPAQEGRKAKDAIRPIGIGTKQARPVLSSITRTSSQETADSPLGPASPADSLATPRKPAGRTWDPKTGVDIFKKGSEEVLARFLRMGSWEDGTQATTHAR